MRLAAKERNGVTDIDGPQQERIKSAAAYDFLGIRRYFNERLRSR